MSRIITKGATSQSLYLYILDSASTVGAGKTGLTITNMNAFYVRSQQTPIIMTLSNLTTAYDAYVSGGFKEIDGVNIPGLYRLDLPDAALAAGADSVVVMLKGPAGMVPVAAVIQLLGADLQGAFAKTTGAIARGTASGGSTTSITTSAFTPSGAVTDQFKGRVVLFDGDTTTAALRGQTATISASTNAANPTLTVSALTTAPASGDTFSVV